MAAIFCRERKKYCNEISARVSSPPFLHCTIEVITRVSCFHEWNGKRIQPYFDCVRAKAVSIQTDIENCTKRSTESEIENKKSIATTLMNSVCEKFHIMTPKRIMPDFRTVPTPSIL